MTKEEILAMLRDEEEKLDLDEVIAFIESEGEREILQSVYEALDLGDDEHDLLMERLSALKTSQKTAEELQSLFDERFAALVEHIAAKYEQLGKSAQAINGFKKRAEKMDFSELDAELDEVNEALKEKLGVADRVTDGSDRRTASVLNLRKLQDYRV